MTATGNAGDKSKITASCAIKDADGDSATITGESVEVTVVGVASIDGPSAVCLGAPATFTATPVPSGATFPANSPRWQYKKIGGGSGGGSPWVNAGSGPTTTIPFAETGKYKVKAKCGESEKEVEITVVEVIITGIVDWPNEHYTFLRLQVLGRGYPNGLQITCTANFAEVDEVAPDGATGTATVILGRWSVTLGPFEAEGPTLLGLRVNVNASGTHGGVTCIDSKFHDVGE